MRLFHLLHGGRGLDPAIPTGEIFDAAISRGAAVVNQPPARDLVVVDYAALVEDAMFDDLDEARVLLGRMTAGHVRGLVVNGRSIVEDGRLATIDFEAARRLERLVPRLHLAVPDDRVDGTGGGARTILHVDAGLCDDVGHRPGAFSSRGGVSQPGAFQTIIDCRHPRCRSGNSSSPRSIDQRSSYPVISR